MKIAGVDIGTTGCKCTVFDAVGKYLGRAYREYPANRNDNGHEIDANLILRTVFETIGNGKAVSGHCRNRNHEFR